MEIGNSGTKIDCENFLGDRVDDVDTGFKFLLEFTEALEDTAFEGAELNEGRGTLTTGF